MIEDRRNAVVRDLSQQDRHEPSFDRVILVLSIAPIPVRARSNGKQGMTSSGASEKAVRSPRSETSSGFNAPSL